MFQDIKDIPFFQHLKDEDLEVLDGYLESYDLEEGEVLFEEGDNGDFVCFVVCGGMDILKKDIWEEEKVIAHISDGAVIGEMSLIDKNPRSASVFAAESCHLAILTERAFYSIVEQQPRIGMHIYRELAMILSQNLRHTNQRILEQ